MHTVKQIIFVSMLVCARLTTAAAQESTSSSAQRSSLTITAAAAGERVRITAPSSVVQMHVEVYAPGGEKLFDQEIRGGNVFDWHLQEGQAQRLASGVYVCVVTAKSISGRLTQKIGTVTVAENSASVQPAESPQLSVQQTQAIGPVEENSSWTIPGSDEPQTPTVIADDGTDGQMIRGRGALTFRIGNFFSGLDQVQMRLTEAVNLGIGTSEPKTKLDVAGAIRAQQGLVFSNGSTLNVSDKGALTLTSDNGTVTPNIAGTGTQNKIAKWKDNAGTLEDSGISETDSGFVGIGIPNPDGPLIVQGTIPTLLGHMSAIRTTGSNNGFGLLMDAAGSGNNNLGFAVNGVRKASFAWDNSRNFLGFVNFNYSANDFGLRLNSDGSLSFNDGNSSAERFRVTSAGNVGIGTPAPQQNLSVNAALNVDQAGLNNGSFNPGITFGSFSGEGISSQRTGGVAGVLTGLNFFTTSINRMS